MKQKTLDLLEEAISSAGQWTWFELTDDSIQLEFDNVQLYKPNFKENNNINNIDDNENNDEINSGNNKLLKHSSELTIRLANNAFFTIFYNDLNDIAFLESKEDFSYKIYINGPKFINGLKFQNFDSFNKINKNYSYNKNILGKFTSSINEIDFLVTISFEKFAIVCGANQLDFFNDFESLNDKDIKKLSNQWIIYLVDYWKAKKSGKEYEYDPACEVFL